MPRVRFVKDFVWKAKRGVRIAYKGGNTYGVTARCLKDAEKAGAVAAVIEPGKASDARR